MAYEHKVGDTVYKLQTTKIYSRGSDTYHLIYAFREELMNGWVYVNEIPEGKDVLLNKATGVPFLISRIKIAPCRGYQIDLEEMIADAEKDKHYKNRLMDYRDLEEKIHEWAEEKGIFEKATPMKQALKTLEEVTELINAIDSNDEAEVSDALGDILVTIIIQAEMQGMDLIQCLEGAYNVIAKRTGRMIDGQFVKDN